MADANLVLWNRFADIDPKFTKPITGKQYKGTSPNPHYVIKCLTEMFGPVGVGFGWEVKAEGFTPLGEEVLHWCRIRFWHGEGQGFEAYGQTKALMKTRNGMMSDEDAPKKSLTDAITKAAAQVGVASNIFLGRWDDSRYVQEVNAEYRREEREKAQSEAPAKPRQEQRQEPGRDPKAVADGIISAVRKRETAGAVLDLLKGDKAREAMEWLKAGYGFEYGRATTAIDEHKAKLDPARQAPADDMHEYQ